jgi:hypothetical protein
MTAVDRRNNPPMPLDQFMKRELLKLAQQFCITAVVFGVSLALLVVGGAR